MLYPKQLAWISRISPNVKKYNLTFVSGALYSKLVRPLAVRWVSAEQGDSTLGARLETVGHHQIHSMVAQQILGQISAWRLRAGDALPGERHLSTELGVSRTAVREALKFLSAKGVVAVSHGRKTVIATDPSRPLRESLQRFPSSDEIILNLFEVRESFEADIAALAAQRATPSEVDQLAQLVAQMGSLPADGERSAFVKLDLAFHNLLAQSTQNPVFSALLQSIRELIVKSRYRDVSLKHTLSCTRDHEQVFAAVRDGDPGRARKAMQKHIRTVKDAFARAALAAGREHDRKEVDINSRMAPARWG